MRLPYLLLIVLLSLSEYISASYKLNFRNIDVQSGISDNYIQSILRDKYGFMWFATLNGLNRYDGYQFKHYTTTQLGSYNNDVESILEDASGTIWIKGPVSYYYYNRELDIIDNKISPILNDYGIEGEVSYLTVDKDFNLWCCVNNTLYYYVFEENNLQSFTLPQNKPVIEIACRKKKPFILFSDGDIFKINRHSGNIERETRVDFLSPMYQHIYIDTSDKLWHYTTHSSGLKCYDINKREWIGYHGEEFFRTNLLTSVMDDGDGNLWIGTDNNGVYINYLRENRIVRLKKEAHDPFSLSNNHINCFFKDSHNTMWVGTSKQGISYTSLDNISFDTYTLPEYQDIRCILEDKDGNLWYGFDGEGLCHYNFNNNTFKIYNREKDNIPSDLVICSFIDSKDRIWFGTYGGGIFYRENGKFIKLEYPYTKNNEDPLLYVLSIIEDKNGNIWFGTFMKGLYRLNPDNTFTAFTMDNTILMTNSITEMVYSGDKNLYVGTGSGLYNIDIKSGRMSRIDGNKAKTQSLTDIHINALYYDKSGCLWIGTRYGIDIFNETKDEITHISKKEGLSHNYIRAIAEDNNDNFWISTDHGITQIISVDPVLSNGNRYLCYPYYNEDGIGSLVFNNHSILCHSTGVIIMGGIGGYLVINTKPSNFYSNINNQIVFTSLFINNETIDAGNKISDGRIILPKNIQLLNNIILNYSDTNFAIDVSSMDYQNQHKKQFVYRFGDNEEWVKAETNRIHFNKLSPGIYNLEVKVKESNNLRNNPVSTLTIIVQPPLWLSLPAYFIYFIIICLIIFSYIKYLKRKHEQMLIKQKEKLEAIQLRETNEAKMQFFTNVSHDLRTPLSLIITPLEKLISLDFPHSRKEELRLVHRNAMILQNEVNQLLEFRKYDQQQVILNPSYSNLSVFINEICNSYRQIFNQNKIVFNIDIIDKEIETAFDNNKMERIILNILSNAIKYNKENGSVTILVDSVTINNDIFARIMVADTGIGIKDENKQKVFERFFQEDNATRTYAGSGIGLHIVNEYVKLHNGTVTIKDNKPEGTIFIIDIPITEKPHSDEVLQPEKTESVKKENILIVEDNSDFRKFIAGCLIEKYNVFEASNGKDALDVLSENFINIVVSDIMMAEMDGIELCQRMKTNISFSHIPIILISARSEDEHILSGLREGADEYITKPFNLEILLLKITKLLKWSALNHEKFKTLDVPTSDISLSNLDKKLIDKTIHIIAQNMDNSEFSVEDLSSEVGMSRSNLYKKLISVTGKSPIEFIRAIRLKEGRILLEKKEFTISEVAYKVGLSPKQFAKYFKDEFGCLPSEYEKSETLES